MESFVLGRVVDGRGTPIEGAEVTLDKSFRPESSDDWSLFRTRTDSTGAYSFRDPGIKQLRERLDHALAVRAFADGRASRKADLVWGDWPLRVPDLVLLRATPVRVAVRSEDGRPANRAVVQIFLSERDHDSGITSFEGEADDAGELLFRTVPDVEYAVWLTCRHPDAAPYNDHLEAKRMHRTLRVKLRRAKIVRGRLLTQDGKPAVRFRVAPSSAAGGDAHADQVVETDEGGRFELGGLDPDDGSIAVYAPIPPEPEDPMERLTHFMAFTGRAANPILVHAVGKRGKDLGDIVAPRLGELVVRLQGPDGKPASGGHVFWSLSRVMHAKIARSLDKQGTARFEGVPLDEPLDLDLAAVVGDRGELQERLPAVRVVDGEFEHRVAGIGTVVLQLESNGKPVEVPTILVETLGGMGAGFQEQVASEFRGWTKPGFYRRLRVKAPGYAPCFLRNVLVRDDGPTYLTAELSSLPPER